MQPNTASHHVSHLIVHGGRPLRGHIVPSANKNAVLLLCATLLTAEKFVLCAVFAQGRSRLTNAACEPHVQEPCVFLGRMGARIFGASSSQLQVDGAVEMGGTEYTFDDDFQEVATLPAPSAICGDDVLVHNGASVQFPQLDRVSSTSSMHRARRWSGRPAIECLRPHRCARPATAPAHVSKHPRPRAAALRQNPR